MDIGSVWAKRKAKPAAPKVAFGAASAEALRRVDEKAKAAARKDRLRDMQRNALYKKRLDARKPPKAPDLRFPNMLERFPLKHIPDPGSRQGGPQTRPGVLRKPAEVRDTEEAKLRKIEKLGDAWDDIQNVRVAVVNMERHTEQMEHAVAVLDSETNHLDSYTRMYDEYIAGLQGVGQCNAVLNHRGEVTRIACVPCCDDFYDAEAAALCVRARQSLGSKDTSILNSLVQKLDREEERKVNLTVDEVAECLGASWTDEDKLRFSLLLRRHVITENSEMALIQDVPIPIEQVCKVITPKNEGSVHLPFRHSAARVDDGKAGYLVQPALQEFALEVEFALVARMSRSVAVQKQVRDADANLVRLRKSLETARCAIPPTFSVNPLLLEVGVSLQSSGPPTILTTESPHPFASGHSVQFCSGSRLWGPFTVVVLDSATLQIEEESGHPDRWDNLVARPALAGGVVDRLRHVGSESTSSDILDHITELLDEGTHAYDREVAGYKRIDEEHTSEIKKLLADEGSNKRRLARLIRECEEVSESLVDLETEVAACRSRQAVLQDLVAYKEAAAQVLAAFNVEQFRKEAYARRIQRLFRARRQTRKTIKQQEKEMRPSKVDDSSTGAADRLRIELNKYIRLSAALEDACDGRLDMQVYAIRARREWLQAPEPRDVVGFLKSFEKISQDQSECLDRWMAVYTKECEVATTESIKIAAAQVRDHVEVVIVCANAVPRSASMS
mmetsp:Transcript_33616/g.71090  ORF Transcript_33616/g.71090 Transcript_33616/m.71090 type:complete len:731 (-) Transcript_33616:5-2197(-)